MMKTSLHTLFTLMALLALCGSVQAEPSEKIVYKQIGDVDLSLHIFYPEKHKPSDQRPAMVFFHGGGWRKGHPSQFYRQSQYLAEKGMVAISAEYRLSNKHGTTPKESLKDGKSAIRWVRAHAAELGINPDKIAAGGGSAGGHVAAATGTATTIEEASDDKTISHYPQALVLFNPVFDNGPGGYGHQRVQSYWQDFSPLHNVTSSTPPTLGLFGENDTAISVRSAMKFDERMQQVGSYRKTVVYKNQPHGFFNEVKYTETLAEMEQFLVAQGFLDAEVQGRAFYIDAESGSDRHSGLSPEQAWASLKKVNHQQFSAGDRILFKAGTVYYGALEPKGSGNALNPIVIDRYGQGAKPLIHGEGKKPHTLLLHNVEHWQVNNLAITNKGKRPAPRRRGVIVSAEDIGELHNIELKGLEIYDVNGVLEKKKGGGSGILIRNQGKQVPSRFVGLKITGNHIHHTTRNGINFLSNASRDHWFPNLQVKIKDNLIEQVPGDGIVVIGSDGALIEGNTLRDFPDILPEGDAAAGIWPWSSDNTVIQFNEVSGHKAKWDGQGYDSDFNSIGTIIQYNYSHDNYGGFLLVCNNGFKYKQDINIGTIGTIIRGNVSINDGIRPYPTHRGVFSPTFHLTGPIDNTRIYDNIIIVPSKPEGVDNTLIAMDDWGKAWPRKTLFENNQIYFEGDLKIDLREVTDIEIRNNQFSKPVVNADPQKNSFEQPEPFNLENLKAKALEMIERKKNEI
ncbi:alpha/beta hydrolase fold domain-containing protein [Microbulbifer agarilyticus]|uniref:alpha/beta hydrolase fold domain-containing protein n=1 Tax=Microbulbifer agarilyticus TaxID=260552 RepID=UPI001CD648BE|nr:alpha/beta hydrolase fold domain-containing protein [Microbulbifer agarilyticus]MCA0900806.1 alpha/beta hydrolase fold domain-containing protein [Microbulbifer agarilyticus]